MRGTWGVGGVGARHARGLVAAALSVGCVASPATPFSSASSLRSDGQQGESGTSRGEGLACRVGVPEARSALCALFERLDADCDRRLTVLDERSWADTNGAGVRPFDIGTCRVPAHTLQHASQAATEIADALSTVAQDGELSLDLGRIMLPPAAYLAQRIERRFWSGLTRSLDPGGAGFWAALGDEKVGGQQTERRALCSATPRCPDPAARVSSLETSAPAVPSLYYPLADPGARTPYAQLEEAGRLRLAPVPNPVTPQWVRELTRSGSHGALTMAYDGAGHPLPFVVPGGRFNEMYGWDSFFIVWGLLAGDAGVQERSVEYVARRLNRLRLARSMVEHHAYQIEHYGKVLNANRTYYLTRSQPPFFVSMLRQVAGALSEVDAGASDGSSALKWLAKWLPAAEHEYQRVWSAAPRRTSLCDGDVCLARYYGEGRGQPPEVEPGHFSATYQRFAVQRGDCVADDGTASSGEALVHCAERLEQAYTSGSLNAPALDAFFVQDRCVRESGHDTTFRWFVDGEERCADHVTVDLNALLFRYELELAQSYFELGDDESKTLSRSYCQRAEARQRLMQRYLWDDERALFADYDFVRQRRSSYVSATTLYPLWASIPSVCGVQLVTDAQARRLVAAALPLLEGAGGLQATSPESVAKVVAPTVVELKGGVVERGAPGRQWESPNGWAPHQMLAWAGLQQYGFGDDAKRLIRKWIGMIAANAADYHGTVPEKYDVQRRSHRVFAEYGNVNTEFSYIAREGFGWMNASFIVGSSLLEDGSFGD